MKSSLEAIILSFYKNFIPNILSILFSDFAIQIVKIENIVINVYITYLNSLLTNALN